MRGNDNLDRELDRMKETLRCNMDVDSVSGFQV